MVKQNLFMKYVEIYKLGNNGNQEIIATCSLANGQVICRGDRDFVQYLEREGIFDYSDSSHKKLFFKDGLKFLEQLKFNFKSGYLNASDIKEE